MSRRLFRVSAQQRYNERLEKVELPRLASAPWLLLAWLGALLLLLFVALLLAARLPEYAAGPLIVVGTGGNEVGGSDAVVLLPAAYAPRLAAGQLAEITLPALSDGEDTTRIRARLTTVEPEFLSPADARARYSLDPADAGQLDGPVVAAAIGVDLPADVWRGSVGEARITIGTRSILARLPEAVAGETILGNAE
jgi:hypothetical protein